MKKIIVFGLCLISLIGCAKENEDTAINEQKENTNCRTNLISVYNGKFVSLIPTTSCD